MQSTRACPVCLETKDQADFRPQRRPCRACLNSEQAARRRADPDRARSLNRKSYWATRETRLAAMSEWGKLNRESRRTYARQYRSDRRDHINARERARYAADPSVKRAANARWRMANSDAVRASHRAFMAGRNQVVARGRFTQEAIGARLAAFGYSCWMCGDTWEHLDHVKPLSKGGPHMLSNIRPACGPCNRAKGGKWFGVQRLSVFVRTAA